MKTFNHAIKLPLIVLMLLFSLNAFAAKPSEPQKPVALNPTYPPGWDMIGTDGQGSKWFLYQVIKPTAAPKVFRVQIDMLPSEDNQAFKDAGAIGIRYLADVDCAERTLLFIEFTAQKKDGTSEHYVYPSDTKPEQPSGASVMVNMIDMVCKKQ